MSITKDYKRTIANQRCNQVRFWPFGFGVELFGKNVELFIRVGNLLEIVIGNGLVELDDKLEL